MITSLSLEVLFSKLLITKSADTPLFMINVRTECMKCFFLSVLISFNPHLHICFLLSPAYYKYIDFHRTLRHLMDIEKH